MLSDTNQPCQQSIAGLTEIGARNTIWLMAKEKLSPTGRLIMRLDAAVLANAEPDEYVEDELIWRQPAKDLAAIFGLGEKLLEIRSQERDHPTIIQYQTTPGYDGVRMRVFHVFGSEVIEIAYDRRDGTILDLHRTGSPYPAHISGSRWYGDDHEVLLSVQPELVTDKVLSKKQISELSKGKARIISYYFFPNRDAQYYNYLEGSARILYYWDIAENTWTYLAHSERDFGTKADASDVFKHIPSADTEAIVTIYPFGAYDVPRQIQMADLLKNLFFPYRVEEHQIRQRPDIFPGINHDFLGVRQIL